jgi:hypothetical protein
VSLQISADPALSGHEGSPRTPPHDGEAAAREDRVHAAVRRRWDRIDWTRPIPPGTLVIPEAHYMDVAGLGLTERQRVAINRLFACFTCELFIHFEGYVIRYLDRSAHRAPYLSAPVVARFVAEERTHAEMFGRLLHRLRPDLYPTDAAPPRFLRWGRGDDAALRLAPAGTFFLLAWYFEEITLFVPRAIEARPDQSAALVAEIMALHAREEAPHVAIDERVLLHLNERCPRWLAAIQTALALPFLVYVDGVVGDAWRRLVASACSELGLDAAQRRRLGARAPTQSDRWGTESFTRKLEGHGLAGAPALCWALRRALRTDPA